MHIPDLTITSSGRVAVGWLHRDRSFPQAQPDATFVERLTTFAKRYGDSARALGWGAMGGCHSCEFCGKALGFGSFGVPAGGQLFYAPDLIAHYVAQHSYQPPAEFVAAVLASPLPGTPEYTQAVSTFAVRY